MAQGYQQVVNVPCLQETTCVLLDVVMSGNKAPAQHAQCQACR